jgi:hypothetical protein
VVFTAVVLIVALAQGIAGEPIIVGKEKPKTDTVKESKFGKELSRPWEKVSPEAPISGLMFPSMIPRADGWDPKGDRKRKLQEREKKNWMSVMPGELQQEDEAKNFLNVRQYEIEKEDESDNLMFRELDRGSSQGSSRSQNRSGSQKENQNGSQRNDADELERELAAKRAARDESRGESQGAHTASELNFKGVFGSAATESRQSELSLRDVLGNSSQPQVSKSQQAMREEFRTFLHGQPNGQGALSGSFNDPVNSSRGDLTRQPLNPTVGRTPETHNDTFGGQASFAPQRQANSFAQGAFNNNSFPQQQAIPGFPTYTPTPPPTARPFQQAPPNSRMGMNSLGGHTR